MHYHSFTIHIRYTNPPQLGFNASQNGSGIDGVYNFSENSFVFTEKTKLSAILTKNSQQFLKILRSAYKGNILANTQITGIIIPDFPFQDSAAFNSPIHLPDFSNPMQITCNGKQAANIPKLVCDGSFYAPNKKAAFAGIISIPQKPDSVYSGSLLHCSSNQAELIAVLEGLKRMQEFSDIQINTDSRFVIKGLIQWVHFWKLNNWNTAFGQAVKFASEWQSIYNLCQNKSLTFQWIKGHAGDAMHTFCHNLARQLAAES